MEENGNWRQKVRNLNLNYLNLVKEIGAIPDSSGYAQTVLGLDGDRLKLLVDLSHQALQVMADVPVLLFRPRLGDLSGSIKLCRKGNMDRATSLLVAGVTADSAKEGEV